ncbi:predicted protein [Arabidopsis lyrata subsp. lyrata]|uniref:Predicted protein n=1 Tax=Arabidopsis lyrata subsp. lyrata TaxID=81972 RepID=D7MXN8_ARALL|nr:predicted protein [Arabidopsis lyrata subsp. lyrata]
MANSWFPNSLVSPPATAGSLNRPPPLPPDPPDPSSPSDFPSLATGRLLPRKIFHKSQIVSAPVKVTSPTSESFPPPTEVVSVAQLLSSYLVSSSNLSQNPRSGTIPTGSETATVATVFSENLNSSTTSTIPSPPSQSLPGILGATPASFPQSSIPPLQSSKLDYVVINGSSISNLTSLPPISNPNPPLPKAATGPPSYASKVKPSVDKSLKRLSPVSFSPSGIPRVEIPDEVFHKGAELHKDFLICRFFGRIPPYHLTQSVLNFMWGKGKHLEIHLSPAGNSVLWSASLDNSSPSLQRIPLWAHLKDVPFDLIHQQGLSHIAGLIGEPIETDDWTINLTSISIAHTTPTSPIAQKGLTSTSEKSEAHVSHVELAPIAVKDSQLVETMVLDISPQKETIQSVVTSESPIAAGSPMDVQADDILLDCVLALKAEFVSRPIVVSDNTLSLPLTNKFDALNSTPTSFNPFIPSKPPYTTPNPPSITTPTPNTNSYSIITTQSHLLPSSPNTKAPPSSPGQSPLFTQKEAHSKTQ